MDELEDQILPIASFTLVLFLGLSGFVEKDGIKTRGRK